MPFQGDAGDSLWAGRSSRLDDMAMSPVRPQEVLVSMLLNISRCVSLTLPVLIL